jgi:hypothetical protein
LPICRNRRGAAMIDADRYTSRRTDVAAVLDPLHKRYIQ